MSARLIERASDLTSGISLAQGVAPVGFVIRGPECQIVIDPQAIFAGPIQAVVQSIHGWINRHPGLDVGRSAIETMVPLWYGTAIPAPINARIVTPAAERTSTPIQERRQVRTDDLGQLFESLDAQVKSLLRQNYVDVAPEVLAAAHEVLRTPGQQENDEAWATRIADQTADFGD